MTETKLQKGKRLDKPAIAGRFQLDEDEFAKLKEDNQGLDLLKVGVPGIGVVVLCPAKRGDIQRFRKRTMGRDSSKYSRDDCLEELARCSIVYPDVEQLDEEIDAKRKYLAWIELGSHASALAGFEVEKIEGN